MATPDRQLTLQQSKILTLTVRDGLSQGKVAKRLGLKATSTVRESLEGTRHKLGCKSNQEAYKKAVRENLIDPHTETSLVCL